MDKVNRRRAAWVGACAVLIAGCLYTRFSGLSNGLPETLHPDEKMIIHRALYFSSGDLNPHFFAYPSLSMYYTSAVIGVGVVTRGLAGCYHSLSDIRKDFLLHPEIFYHVARMGSALAGSVTVLLLFLWGRRFRSDAVAFISACFVLLSPSLIEQSRIMKPDSLLTLFGLIGFLAAAEAVQRRSVRWLYASAAAFGLAVSTKYNAVFFGLAPFIAWVLLFTQRPRSQWSQMAFHGIGIAVISVAAFFVGTPFALIDRTTFYAHLFSQAQANTAGIEGMASHSFLTNVAMLFKNLGQGWNVSWALIALFGMALVGSTLYQRIAAIVTAAFFITVASTGLPNFHYYSPSLPLFFFVLPPDGFAPRSRWMKWIVVFLTGYALLGLAYKTEQRMKEFRRPDSRSLAKQWILSTIPDGAKIVTDASGPELPLNRTGLDEVLEKAVAAGHVKASLFKMQIEAYDPAQKHFDVYLSSQGIVITAGAVLEASRKIQRLQPMDRGIEPLIRQGIQWFITSSGEESLYRTPELPERLLPYRHFYDMLAAQSTVKLVFDSAQQDCAGVRIRVYQAGGG